MTPLPWIKVCNDLPDHPKSDALANALGVERAWTHVLELWLWASKHRADGDLTGMSDEQIAKRAGWSYDSRTTFCDASRSVGFLDGESGAYRLHDWMDHQEAHARKLANDRAKSAAKRELLAASRRQSQESRTTIARPSVGQSYDRRGDKIESEKKQIEKEELSAVASAPPDMFASEHAEALAMEATGLPEQFDPNVTADELVAAANRPTRLVGYSQMPDGSWKSDTYGENSRVVTVDAATRPAKQPTLPGVPTPAPSSENAPTGQRGALASKPAKGKKPKAADDPDEAHREARATFAAAVQRIFRLPAPMPWPSARRNTAFKQAMAVFTVEQIIASVEANAREKFGSTQTIEQLLEPGRIEVGLRPVVVPPPTLPNGRPDPTANMPRPEVRKPLHVNTPEEQARVIAEAKVATEMLFGKAGAA